MPSSLELKLIAAVSEHSCLQSQGLRSWFCCFVPWQTALGASKYPYAHLQLQGLNLQMQMKSVGPMQDASLLALQIQDGQRSV